LLFGILLAATRFFHFTFTFALFYEVIILSILMSVFNWKTFQPMHHLLSLIATALGVGLGLLVFLSTTFAEVWMDELTGEKVHEAFINISIAMGYGIAHLLMLPLEDRREKVLQVLFVALILYIVSFISLDLFIKYPLFNAFIVLIYLTFGLATDKNYNLQRAI
jgi:hypothetical protein